MNKNKLSHLRVRFERSLAGKANVPHIAPVVDEQGNYRDHNIEMQWQGYLLAQEEGMPEIKDDYDRVYLRPGTSFVFKGGTVVVGSMGRFVDTWVDWYSLLDEALLSTSYVAVGTIAAQGLEFDVMMDYASGCFYYNPQLSRNVDAEKKKASIQNGLAAGGVSQNGIDEFMRERSMEVRAERAKQKRQVSQRHGMHNVELTIDLLGNRVVNILKSEGICYLGDLIQLSERTLLNMPGMGKRALEDIKTLLARHELSLEMSVGDWKAPTK